MSDDPAEAVEAMQAEAEAAVEADALECLIEAGRLNDVLDVLQSVAHESVMHFGRDGLETRMVDPSNVFVADIELSADAFADTGNGKFPIGVNLEQFQDYLSKADDGTLVSLSFDTETRRLRIQYDSVDVHMASIDPDAIREEPNFPDLDLPNHVTVPYADFRDGAEVVEMLSETVTIEGRPDEGAVALTGDGDTDDAEYVLDSETIIDGKITEGVESIFSLGYLLGTKPPGILKQMPKNEIDFRFGDEFPLRFSFDIASGTGTVEAMLAPRVDSS